MNPIFVFPLFVPADRADRLPKAMASGADAILADLEDAVARDRKAAAREQLARAVSEQEVTLPICIRINGEADSDHAKDLDLVGRLPLAAVMLPKAESAAAVLRVRQRTGLPVIALIETARGLAHAREIATEAVQLAFGSIDFAADLGVLHTQTALLQARFGIVLASRLAGIAAPLDGVTAAVRDAEQIQRDCTHAVEMGFGGKLLIHPDQVPLARSGFAPDPKLVEWAKRALSAEGAGAVLVDGEMVDEPVLARARQVLARAG